MKPAPLINAPRAEARKATSSATSSGRPGRAMGMPPKHFHNPLTCSVLADAATLGNVGDHSVGAGSLDETGRHHRDSHSLPSDTLGQPLAVGSKGSLGRSVGQSRIGKRQTMSDRRNMNDDP